jgi:hypothetical protein
MVAPRSLAAGLCLAFLASGSAVAEEDSLAPTAYLTAVVTKASQDRFLHQLQTFADSHVLKTDVLRIPIEDPDARLMTRAQLWNDDLQIIAINTPNLCSFEILFYPMRSGSGEEIQSSRSSLAEALRDVDGVTVTEAEVPVADMPPAPCD